MTTYAVYSLLFAPNVLILMAIISTVLWLCHWRKLAMGLMGFGLLWVLAWSLPATTLLAGGYLENRYPARAAADYPAADVIVVLGGHIQGNRHNWFEDYDKKKVVSRESIAADLFQAKRAELILLSGGALEGPISDTANMARALKQMGIPSDAILQETESQNTLENARLTDQALQDLQKQRIILVTSALHMPRAMTAFLDQPMDVTPAPLPAQIRWSTSKSQSIWLPDLHTLLASQTILKEYAGLFLYWLRALL